MNFAVVVAVVVVVAAVGSGCALARKFLVKSISGCRYCCWWQLRKCWLW